MDPLTNIILEQDTPPIKINSSKIFALALAKAQKKGVDIKKDAKAVQRLKRAINISAKQFMKKPTRYVLKLPFLTKGPKGPYHLTLTLSKAQLMKLT